MRLAHATKGARGRKFKSSHSDKTSREIVKIVSLFLLYHSTARSRKGIYPAEHRVAGSLLAPTDQMVKSRKLFHLFFQNI
jgi:hypothetical protein